MTDKWWFGKDVIGSGCDVIEAQIPPCVYVREGIEVTDKSLSISFATAEFRNWNMYSSNAA